MKIWPLFIGIIVILALLYSPVLAISKGELMAFHKSQVCPEGKCNPTSPISDISYTTPLPTPTPTPYIPSWAGPAPVTPSGKSFFPSWFSPSWMIPWKNASSLITPVITPVPTPTPSASNRCTYPSCPPAEPAGWLEPATCNCTPGTRDIGQAVVEVFGDECIDPETGQSYPIGIDTQGNCYVVKPGCVLTWAGFA